MSKVLVAFHSRTGYTRRVALALARTLHADLEAVEPVRIRSGVLGYVRCALEALGRWEPEIRTPSHDAKEYELLVIGTPVWFWRLASPVRSYVTRHAARAPRVAFFCTMGAQGSVAVLAELARLTGRAPVAALALTDRDIDRGYASRLDAFVQALRAPGRRGIARRRAAAVSATVGRRAPAGYRQGAQ
jgi:hypothetical protein